MEKISTIVITYNEERNVERCLSSVAGISDEIVVVDSNSSDLTVERARAFTDTVLVHPWEGYAKQKQFAISRCTNRWILWIDADEEVSLALQEELKSMVFSYDGYYVAIKPWYLGRWIRHSGWFPGHGLRLFRKDKAAFNENIVHESIVVSGKTGYLSTPLFHYPYRSIAHHIEKMNRYTTLGAEEMLRKGRRASPVSIVGHTVWKLVGTYIFKRGFLDGAGGLIISILGSCYVFLKYVKLYEMQRASRINI